MVGRSLSQATTQRILLACDPRFDRFDLYYIASLSRPAISRSASQPAGGPITTYYYYYYCYYYYYYYY